ncbi:hypothetical protein UFOVP509_7 [uncultured Caudovirales phage]|uniref:Uncharacterized protein n=1 Tax=uncultured Caudovirales phage TaxID=2100421 RepID=A0A6J5MLW4_9CAUD|nr:hypothetical protein UFOVP509_7 [uncultured Caudovirales phage]
MKLHLGKLDFGKIISLSKFVGGAVKAVQAVHGAAPGADKHQIVADAALSALPFLEGLTGLDVADNAKILALLNSLIALEKSAMNASAAVVQARADLDSVIADLKSKR